MFEMVEILDLITHDIAKRFPKLWAVHDRVYGLDWFAKYRDSGRYCEKPLLPAHVAAYNNVPIVPPEKPFNGVTLGYWAIRGRAGAIRMALEAAGVEEWRDELYTPETA